ncbi:MAG: 2-hydroxyglutaryl-CoA dehydratase, partial [Oscillospiraceae bacterium]|nr:2-hydroxyglutaryl-CoA dehydratase [Oscillospiraceae bacterium]
YAKTLLNQKNPCMRMQFYREEASPYAVGTIFNTVKFCDYYGFQYRALRGDTAHLLKIETDCSRQSGGQLKTRIDAFSETLGAKRMNDMKAPAAGYFAGVDSGSASTDAVIIDSGLNIIGSAVLSTGAGASFAAEKALEEALSMAGLERDALAGIVTTGYGRETVGVSDNSVTEITCHARGAHFLCPEARTVIDIGGQDSKVICMDENGNVTGFVMNDKCAAGTGRFLEMMARTLGMSLSEMSERGLDWKEEVTISSMCTVFAESEVVSLIAENAPARDIIRGLNMSVAARTVSLVKRCGGAAPFVMTGGVAKNRGVVRALEEKLSSDIIVPEEAQLCGALGAALTAASE